MKITELDKQIIEIIEPYMDKTLSFGCVLDYKKRGREYIYIDDREIINIKTWYLLWYNKWDISEILWHYDITAVLKYIGSVVWKDWNGNDIDYYCHAYRTEIHLKETRIWNDNNEIELLTWVFPNKPLHLYTEEEDKALLELLQKLWNK